TVASSTVRRSALPVKVVLLVAHRSLPLSSLFLCIASFFFFNDTATTEIYTLSLHDALPISQARGHRRAPAQPPRPHRGVSAGPRSEEHTSELQSHLNLVCRLLLEKKKIIQS